ncbi:MAG: hypothetical protein ACK6CT_09880 [Planctomycetia bacterium]
MRLEPSSDRRGRWAEAMGFLSLGLALVFALPLALPLTMVLAVPRPAAAREPAARPADDELTREALEQKQKQRRQVLNGQQQQVDQTTAHYENQWRPLLWAELDRARRICGDLPPDARRAILAAGTKALQSTARQFAEQQFGARPHQPIDVPESIRAGVVAAMEKVAPADAFATYNKEHADRQRRRARAAQGVVVVNLDQRLLLVEPQRRAIAADLEKQWQPAWNVASREQPFVNNQSPAPDYAAKSIEPHLDDRQRADWKNWCEQAGWQKHNLSGNGMSNTQLWHDNVVQQADPWWSP